MTSKDITKIVTAFLLAYVGGLSIGIIGDMMGMSTTTIIIGCLLFGFFVPVPLAEKLIGK